MATIKFANGKEYTLAATPEFSSGYGNVLITASDTVTAEAVRTEVSDYNNTKSFTIDGGAPILYYYKSGPVSIDDAGNIAVSLRQKTAAEQQLESQAMSIALIQSALIATQARI